MLFLTLGIIIGFLISILLVIILVYFRHPIESKVIVIEKAIENAGPRPKGFIVEPESESDEARASIIAENKKMGKDTRYEELL